MPRSEIDSPLPALRTIALMEALKGLIVLGAGFGMLALVHHDVRHVAESLVTRLHIAPGQHYAGIFLSAASRLNDARLWGLALLSLAYSALRGVEAWGLWFGRRWAAWLGAAGGAIYLPVEFYELWHKPSPVRFATLGVNAVVVAYLVWALRRSRAVAAASG